MVSRIAVFVGTRPEGIKMAPVIRALLDAQDFEPVVISTGQHREMLQQVFELFALPIDVELSVMEPNQALAALTAKLLQAIDGALERVKPVLSLVQGDTTTVLAASLASFYRGIPVGHVEAGLRTHNMAAPFPEEANRVLASRLASIHFAPTRTARDNLLREGVSPDSIVVTGNTVIDALLLEVERQRNPAVQATVREALSAVLGHEWGSRPYVLVTGHRRESFGAGFVEICQALRELAVLFPTHEFIYPVHLNPNVRGPVFAALGGVSNVRLVPPQHYSHFVALMSHAKVILTDSGGVQEEAPGLGKPVLVMRETTERPEGLEAGTVRLVGAHRNAIVDGVSELLEREDVRRRMSEAVNPYGDGEAAGRILEKLRAFAQQP